MEVSGRLHAAAVLALELIEQKAGWALEPVWTLLRKEQYLAPDLQLTTRCCTY
jgi:hypothetical protein